MRPRISGEMWNKNTSANIYIYIYTFEGNSILTDLFSNEIIYLLWQSFKCMIMLTNFLLCTTIVLSSDKRIN